MSCACDTDCSTLVSIPGPRGSSGTDGDDGSDGINAFTFTTASFTMPDEGDDVTVSVEENRWAGVGQLLYLTNAGTLQVVSKTGTTQLLLLNLEDTATGLYPENANPGTVIASGQQISPAGPQGASGAAPSGALLSANNLSDVASPATSRSNLGLGTASTRAAGVANTNVAPVDDAAGLTAGELVRATATGLESVAAATGRTALGLGTIATQDAGAVAITGGVLSGTTSINTTGDIAALDFTASGEQKLNGKLFTAPTGIQSLLAATAINPNAAKIRVVGNGGPVTLTATPTITTPGDDGQLLLIMGTSDVNTVTLQDEASLAGTKLQLAAATRALGAGDHILLSWDATTGFWYEVAFSNN